jgi:hypothetical protein
MAAGDILRGAVGTCQVGPSGTPVAVTKMEKWTLKSERSTEEVGPFINDEQVYEIVGGKKGQLDLEGVVPEEGDAGQDDMIDAYENGTTLRTVVTTTKGKIITFTAGTYKSLEISTDAKGTQRIKVSVAGAYTITQGT